MKNVDFREVYFEIDGQVKLRFAKTYGFRNIQTIVQKIKKNMCPYDFVEVMACPLGCLNGGGQIRDKQTQTLDKDLFQKVDLVYNSVVNTDPIFRLKIDDFINKLYQEEWLKRDPSLIKKHLHTTYHEIPKIDSNLNIKW
jgi:iron only hydrogenase large subunit-like protein